MNDAKNTYLQINFIDKIKYKKDVIYDNILTESNFE